MNIFYVKQRVRWPRLSYHTMLVMKITTFLILAGCLQVSATSYGQKVTLSERNASLEQVFKKLKQQTGLDFLYGAQLSVHDAKINLDVQDQELSVVLDYLLTNQPFSYSISDKTVVIKQENLLRHQVRVVEGKVADEDGKPLQSAVVRIKGRVGDYFTDVDGLFILKNVPLNAVIEITHVGYEDKEIKVEAFKVFLTIVMRTKESKIEEVNVFSTGYEQVPRERATGSFEQVNKELFNRSIGTDVISRLKGVTTSTIFGEVGNLPSYTVPYINSGTLYGKRTPDKFLTHRGISTLTTGSGAASPLIVLDNFPYVGDINNINPNDIESVTVLKDAAASSVWGFKAANGVIVITTKRAKYEQSLRFSLSSNITIGDKPNLFYQRQMSSSDYIDVEKFNFEKGIYNSRINLVEYYPMSPVVNLLVKQRSLPIDDLIGRAIIEREIDAYRTYDRRNDYLKYLYRKTINQQYALELSNGGKKFSYMISGGYNHDRGSEIETGYSRGNIRNSLSFKPSETLEFNSDIYITINRYYSTAGTGVLPSSRVLDHLPYEPYTRLADENGNPLEIVNPINMYQPLKSTYRQTAGNGRLLDWVYKPLDDLHTSEQSSRSQNLQMNFRVGYQILPSLKATINYQYGKNVDEHIQYNSDKSYIMRDFLNAFATYSKTDLEAPPNFQIPLGGQLTNSDQFLRHHSLRVQLDFNKTINLLHDVNLIVGTEGRDEKIYTTPYLIVFGYDPEKQVIREVPYNQQLQVLNGLFTSKAPIAGGTVPTLINRSTSFYTNGSYVYSKRYTLSASARFDGANIYGVTSSQRIKPFWSIGGSWNINSEEFFSNNFFSILKLRATYGYLGNVNNSVSAFPIINYGGFDWTTNLNLATIRNPANPNLKPERSGILNLGMDFTVRNNRFSGSVEYYVKRSKDLIAPTPLAPSTGFVSLNVNSANLKTTGTDVTLNTTNVQNDNFQWLTTLRYSYTKNLVTKYLLPKSDESGYFVPDPSSGTLQYQNYLEGHDPFALYAYKWAGLDPENGDPRGYDKNGDISKDYNSLIRVKAEDLEDYGSVIPRHYGSLINTFYYKGFSMSAMILYKFGYKMSPPGISYYNLYNSTTVGNADYANRWQKPGDENITNVPSAQYPVNISRDMFYWGSAARIISGNHIRLQDIRLSYNFRKTNSYIRSLQLYALLNNVGILWKANKVGIDPDTFMEPPVPLSFTVGFRSSF